MLQDNAPISVVAQYREDENFDSPEVKALTRALISEMKQVSENNNLFSEEMRLTMVNIDNPGKIADFITSILNIDRGEQQKILEMSDVQARMEYVLIFIKKEQELLKIQKKIQDQLNEKITKSQREYYLKEEMKAIKSELGMAVDAKTGELQRFTDAVAEAFADGEVKEQVDQELEKFSLMDANSPEFTVTRNYLETIIALPWNDDSRESIDIDKAMAILNEDHYGLEDVKERIVEYLAVRKLKKDTKGAIVCLVGPPGVGKTSVGKSIARALGRKFFRFSVGGMRDEAEIKGHRRTYIGAMPGKIIQGLKIVKTKNPVYMIDEIDKLGASYQGDPSSALLEVLDPEQNVAFRDHYLDLPFDVSHILFITTANTLDSIPAPLLDRMEIIRLSGYIDREKVAIAKKYLIPKSLERAGLEKGSVKYDAGALVAIADGYAREAGFAISRRLWTRSTARSSRAVPGRRDQASRRAEEGIAGRVPREARVPGRRVAAVITKPGMARVLHGRLSAARFSPSRPSRTKGKKVEAHREAGRGHAGVGEHCVLVYTACVETKRESPGVLGEAPHPPARSRGGHAQRRAVGGDHTRLDPPVTRPGKKLKKALAMTGELSLVGSVLPIGGLKEKVIAARRNQIKQSHLSQGKRAGSG